MGCAIRYDTVHPYIAEVCDKRLTKKVCAKIGNAYHPFQWRMKVIVACTRYDKFLLHIICKLNIFLFFARLFAYSVNKLPFDATALPPDDIFISFYFCFKIAYGWLLYTLYLVIAMNSEVISTLNYVLKMKRKSL